MDFRFSSREEDFKRQVCDFFAREESAAAGARKEWNSGQGFGPCCWEILGKLGAMGWLCPTWPKKYGGLELPYIFRYIIMEEMCRFTDIYVTVGAGMAGPVILQHGSEKQRQEYLPRIARGEIEFALGYTEPQAGSDVAAIEIKAVDKGDYFLINGQKMFNTRVHFSQYHWLGVRTKATTPKYKGISLLIVDLKTPGITFEPIWTVGGRRTNQVFYDDVKAPKEALVGEENRGMYYVMEALDYERITAVAGLERDFWELVEYVKINHLGDDPLVRQKIAELAIDVESSKLLAQRVACILNAGAVPNYEAAMLKMAAAETLQKLVNTAMQVLGPYGQLKQGSRWAPLDGRFEWRYRDSLETLVTQGTSEIMKNIIAQRGFGLPRK
jgi:hypothetical protein